MYVNSNTVVRQGGAQPKPATVQAPVAAPAVPLPSLSSLDLPSSSVQSKESQNENIYSSISSFSPADRARFVLFGIGSSISKPFEIVHHAFAHRAAATPSAIAVEHKGETITYERLDRLSSVLAAALREQGVVPGKRIVLLVQRSIAMVIGIVATHKAGASYIPLDGGIVTDQTLGTILEDSEASMVLCTPEYKHRVPADKPHLTLDAFTVEPEGPIPTIKDLSKPTDEAYVIYTSGTTGRPKGVSVRHENVTNLLSLYPGKLAMKPGARVAQLLNVAFDMCAWEILGSLINGCTLVVRGKSQPEWVSVLKSVDVVIATPSILARYDPVDFPNIKYVATAGEPCPQALADKWSRATNYINSCGPTEITIINTARLHVPGEPVNIGGPTPNNNVYVLDENLKPVPIGTPGVMWAGGAGISSGYVNLPAITAQRYVKDPFRNDGSMMFNTGDLGRWMPNGVLEHLGRVDDQVKVKGFRVELDGVSAGMQKAEGVENAVALLIDGELWGFVSPATADVSKARAAAASILPYYAVPTKYLTVETLPMTSNGKIDKRALKELAATTPALTAKATAAPAGEKSKEVSVTLGRTGLKFPWLPTTVTISLGPLPKMAGIWTSVLIPLVALRLAAPYIPSRVGLSSLRRFF